MATTETFFMHVTEQLEGMEEITAKKMMGEYMLYYRGKLFANLCDNSLLFKPTASVLRLLPDAERVYPYEGSKTLMVLMEDVENRGLLEEIIRSMYEELPAPRDKKKKRVAL